MTQPEKFKQYDASLTKHPNQSFIQLFFAKPNDILRFPLFFEDNPRRLEAIRVRGGLSDFSPEALKQDRKSTRLNSSHRSLSRMPSSA